MAGEATVGSIIAFMRLDRSEFTRDKDAVKREANELDGRRVRITVTTNAREAVAALAAVDAASAKNARSAAGLAAAHRSVANATATVASAQRSLLTSSDSVAQAQQRVAAAQQRIRAAGVGTAEDYKKLEIAQRSLTAAMRSEETASSRVAAALRNQQTAIDRVALAQKRLDDELNKGTVTARRNIGLLSTAIIGLAPALVPLTAVAGGAFTGLVVTAGAAALAIHGISRDMKEGTPVGQRYTAGMTLLTNQVNKLSSTASAGVLRGFSGGIRALQPLLPALNRDVAMFSTGLGLIVGNSVPGLLALLRQLNPLFITFDQQLVEGAQRFRAWASSSDSVTKFVAYAQTQLPIVEHAIGSLAVTIGHLAQAAAPFGSTTLQAITLFSHAINSLPIGVLQTIVPLLIGLKVGLTGLDAANNAAASLAGMASRARQAGGAASATAGLVSGLGRSVSFLGPAGLAAGLALGGLSIIMGRHQQATVATTERVNALTQAIENGTQAVALLTQLQGSGAVEAADKLGISQNTLVQSVLKGGAALDKVKTQIAYTNVEYQKLGAYLESTKAAMDATQNPQFYQSQAAGQRALGAAMGDLSAKLQQAQADYAKAVKAAADYARSQGDAVLAAQLESGAIQRVAASYGLTVDAYFAAKIAADKKTQSDLAQRQAMILESDAAGLLTRALDILNGKNLSVAQAQTGLAGANNQLLDSLKQNGRVINGNTAAAVSNQQAVQGQVQMAQAAAEAIGKSTGSSAAAARSYLASRDAILQQLQAHHLLTPALKGYIDRLYDLKDLKVPPTKIDVDKAAADVKLAAFKTYVQRLPGKTVSINANTGEAVKQLGRIRTMIQTLPSGKVVTITTNSVTHESVIRTPGGVTGKSNAAGGGVPDGWSTVGEQGWEAVHKQGNSVQVYSHQQSKKLLPEGPSVPAFASGTRTAKPKPIILPLTVTAGGGQAYGIASYIKGQIPSVAHAARLLSLAVNDAFTLKGIQSKLAAVKADLANTRKAAGDLRGSVVTNLHGAVNPTAYGSISDLTSAYRGGTATNRQYQGEVATLNRLGLTKSLLAQLAGNGPSVGLDALAGASRTQISELNKAYAGFVGSTGTAGSAVASSVYGSRITTDQRAIASYAAQSARTETAMVRAMMALAQLLHRPGKIVVGNKEFARIMIDSGVVRGIYDDLAHALRYR